VHRLYANVTSFYIRGLGILGFWHSRGVSMDSEGQLSPTYIHTCTFMSAHCLSASLSDLLQELDHTQLWGPLKQNLRGYLSSFIWHWCLKSTRKTVKKRRKDLSCPGRPWVNRSPKKSWNPQGQTEPVTVLTTFSLHQGSASEISTLHHGTEVTLV
jgi:hypothetical protein